MPTTPILPSPITDLATLRQRKLQLRQQLNAASTDMTKEVRTLFAHETGVSPVRRMTGLVTNAGISIDMALMMWRLYRKLAPAKKGKKKKKKPQRRSWMLWKR